VVRCVYPILSSTAGRLVLLTGLLAAPLADAATSDPSPFSIAAYTPSADPTSVGGRADFAFQLNDLQTSLQASVEGGDLAGDGADPFAVTARGQSWTGSQAQMTTTWTPSDVARLEISLSDQLKHSLTQVDLLAPQMPTQATNTLSQSAKVTAVLTPLAPIELRVGGEASSGVVDVPATSVAGVLTAVSNLRNDSGRMFADLTWKPLARFSLTAGEGVQSLGVASQGVGGASYAYVTPHVSGALTPWTNAEWTLSVERSVSQPAAAQFASFMGVADRPAGVSFQPDHGWSYSAVLKQTLPGAVVVSANLTQSNLQSVTDLGPVGTTQAPISIGPGQRRQVDIALTAPVPVPGSAPLKLSASAGWLQSQVTDPFTGARRPISGDAPYKAEVNLAGGRLGKLPLSWAVKAQVTGPQAIYQMSQVDQISQTAGVGGTLAYKAGPITVGLQLDNIVGGGRTDTALTYAGSRAFDVADGFHQTRDDSRAVRLSFSRAL
jgi:hypothetical protein